MGATADSLDCNIKIRFSESEYERLKIIAAANGTSVASMLRTHIRRFIGFSEMHLQKNGALQQISRGVRDGARVDIRLTNEDAELLNLIASSLNTSRARALVLMMRNIHADKPLFTHQEKDALRNSNYYLRLIGNNLNQISKHLHSMNKNAHGGDAYRLSAKVELLYKELHEGNLESAIMAHIELVRDVLRAGRQRFD